MYRVGHGYDVHRFESGKPLILGGIRLPHPEGMKAVSDGDVVIHALCDALLGAAGLGDIGHIFPDTDPANKGKDSKIFLDAVVDMLETGEWEVANADITIIAQHPKMGPHIQEMKTCIAEIIGINPTCLNIKASTREGLGAIGAGEGIEVHVVALIQPTTLLLE